MATSARLTITTNFSDDVFFYELGTSDSLDTLRMLLESESAVPVAEQVLIFNNREATVSAKDFFAAFFFFFSFFFFFIYRARLLDKRLVALEMCHSCWQRDLN